MVTAGDVGEAFARVQDRSPRCVWLDGGGARDWSRRRSILGWLDEDDVSLTYSAARREVTRHAGGRSEVVGDDPFAALEAELAAGSESDQWFGYFGYAARPDLPAAPDPALPDAVWMRPSHVLEFTHVTPAEVSGRVTGTAMADKPGNPRSSGDSRGGEIPADYATAFARVQEHLHAGNSYEVNLTHRLRVENPLAPAAVYLRLRSLNPAPYAGFLQHDVEGARAWLLSSSPERYALVTADRTLEAKPIKGTTPRDPLPEEDAAARARLAGDPKFRSENLMIVDLLRNDLSLVCEVGSVEVPHLMEVESYASVHQLVSTVRGRLREDVTTVGALRSLFPAGSMTGAPKLRTMEIIDEVEADPRGVYSGAFGWVSGDGRADLGVVIRSLATAGDGTYVLGTGGGIIVDSDPAEEYAETRWKAARLLEALRS
ncbi:anthranilate synthase component I family protein [Nocardioides sp. GY 10113]|uniref:anthranilate synthase component I family protein n=1 Tax=Nocardioides sp. GY 10113 TaxID=2569761 RepID=UPI0010A75DD0|nr:anthranilate synthase component I family protein [Nocardioides sp. GY 10113]TIC89068.1 anthranilate synthase component I family protein [Nocardioides sp. GY 10113]